MTTFIKTSINENVELILEAQYTSLYVINNMGVADQFNTVPVDGAVNTPSDQANILVTGVLNFNEKGNYIVQPTIAAGTTNSGSVTTIIMSRVYYNGVTEIDKKLVCEYAPLSIVNPIYTGFTNTYFINAVSGDTFEFQVGSPAFSGNDAALFTDSVTTLGTFPSYDIKVYRLYD